jgi:hypothetical protein
VSVVGRILITKEELTAHSKVSEQSHLSQAREARMGFGGERNPEKFSASNRSLHHGTGEERGEIAEFVRVTLH